MLRPRDKKLTEEITEEHSNHTGATPTTQAAKNTIGKNLCNNTYFYHIAGIFQSNLHKYGI